MTPRNQYDPKERAARSRLAQLLHDHELICGSIVQMARECGKKGCRCERDQKHVSLYLAVSAGKKRKMVYIPARLEQAVIQCVNTYREIQELTSQVSAACVERILKKKFEDKSHRKQGKP